MQKLRVGDKVIVLVGKDKGKSGPIVRLNFKKNVVTVSKINMVKKARRRENQEAADFIEIERPLHISNVAMISPKTKKATRVRIESRGEEKVRVAVACGSVLKNIVKK